MWDDIEQARAAIREIYRRAHEEAMRELDLRELTPEDIKDTDEETQERTRILNEWFKETQERVDRFLAARRDEKDN